MVDQLFTVNNLKTFSVATEKQECFSFELSSYKIFDVAVNNAKLLRSSYKVTIFMSDFKEIWSLSTDFSLSPQ
jgi:hypothetical protein